MSPEFAACINTREIKIWHDSSSLLSHNINIDKWYCFSHRCSQSALLKKIIIKKITGHSHTTWYGPKEIAQMGAGLQKTIRCIQHIWKQYREKKHPPIPTPPLTYKPSHASPRILQREKILKVNPYSLFITKPRPNPYYLLTNNSTLVR